MAKIIEGETHTGVLAGPTILEDIRMHFRFKVPEAWRSPSHDLYRRTNGQAGWDGYKYPFRLLKGKGGIMLRGHTPELLKFLDHSGEIVDKESVFIDSPCPEGITAEQIPDGLVNFEHELDEHQKRCMAAWLTRGIGINYVTVSGGKTLLFLATAAWIKDHFPDARFLYLTPSERLVNQAMDQAPGMLPGWDISQFGGGKKNPKGKDLVIATNATIHKNLPDLLKSGWMESFDCVLADECHHLTSETGEGIMSRLKAPWRFGASDTMKKDDVIKHTLMRGLVGPILESVVYEDLRVKDRVAQANIYIAEIPAWKNKFKEIPYVAQPDTPCWVLHNKVWTKARYIGPAYEEDPDGGYIYDRAGNPVRIIGENIIKLDGEERPVSNKLCLLERLSDRAIIQFKERNALLTRWVEYYAKQQNLRTLVVATRTLHLYILKGLIEKKINPKKVRVLYGTSTSKQRDEVFDWFKETKGSVLITPLVKEGVSIPEIEAGVIADRIADWEYAKQIIGRFIRKKKTGENAAHMLWIADQEHPRFTRTSKALFKDLQQVEGFKFFHPVTEPGTEKELLPLF